jgi:uncharacterized membrane protein YoaK (UPF0700 family)
MGLSPGAIAGIVLGSIVGAVLLFCACALVLFVVIFLHDDPKPGCCGWWPRPQRQTQTSPC